LRQKEALIESNFIKLELIGMKLTKPHTVSEIAELLGVSFIGNGNQLVTGINEIHRVENGDLVFVDHPKYYQKALKSAATIILIDQEVDCPEGKSLLISKNPFDDYNRLTKYFSPFKPQSEMIGEDCKIDHSALIYPNVFIGHRVKICANVTIHPGCYIGDDTVIEENAIIGPNSVLGHYAFYYKQKPEGRERMHSCGNVWIERDVEIGALCSIDAGVSSTTRIGAGTKIDNQVHIGHDTITGKNCLIAGHTGIAGCVTMQDNVILWGQVGVASNIILGEGAVVLAQSGISKDLKPGVTYFGSPAGEVKEKFKEMAAIRQLAKK
jgi:UDP-3-O-[3-hydroxymyristoyl] glucosamine N-acyltransferase